MLILVFFLSLSVQAESRSIGTPAVGRLEEGERLPRKGPNFTIYSDLGWLAGRTYVHSRVRDVLIEAYRQLEAAAPGKVFVIGETGWKSGGRFRPHKTHQNGLSVDLMVPVFERESGKSVPLPTSMFNKFGYSIEFNREGKSGELVIDFDALGELIFQIHSAAVARNLKVKRVIFDPQMIELLHASRRGLFIKEHIEIPRKASWVRHDEHVHIDFEL